MIRVRPRRGDEVEDLPGFPWALGVFHEMEVTPVPNRDGPKLSGDTV